MKAHYVQLHRNICGSYFWRSRCGKMPALPPLDKGQHVSAGANSDTWKKVTCGLCLRAMQQQIYQLQRNMGKAVQ